MNEPASHQAPMQRELASDRTLAPGSLGGGGLVSAAPHRAARQASIGASAGGPPKVRGQLARLWVILRRGDLRLLGRRAIDRLKGSWKLGALTVRKLTARLFYSLPPFRRADPRR